MHYPDFFDALPSIRLIDPLSELLGTFEKGEVNISYLDVVKGAGHSCPSIAGAYLMAYHALRALYPNKRAVRGEILIKFAQGVDEGSTGVLSNALSYITGAADISGFKGLNGKFSRDSLMAFNQAVPSIRFTRRDTGKSVDLFYDPNAVPPDPKQAELMQRILQEKASMEERELFGKIWQERVRRILIENFENKKMLRVEEV